VKNYSSFEFSAYFGRLPLSFSYHSTLGLSRQHQHMSSVGLKGVDGNMFEENCYLFTENPLDQLIVNFN
jgi:hypothetical protein